MKVNETLKYPIGKFKSPVEFEPDQVAMQIDIIDSFPMKIRNAVMGLNDEQLDTPYRPGGWNVRQVVHHVADSHINSYCRFKLALTEDNPVIRPYLQDDWAHIVDAKSAPIFHSLGLLDALHGRWVIFLKTMTEDHFKRTYIHPEHHRSVSLYETVALYAWHCEHHLGHITGLKTRMNW